MEARARREVQKGGGDVTPLSYLFKTCRLA